MLGEWPPFLIFLIGALAAPLIPSGWRGYWALAVAVFGLLSLVYLPEGNYWQIGVLDLTLELGRVDRLSFIFGLLFHIAAIIGTVFALHVRDPIQHVSALLYGGSALGAVFAGDLISLFIFWEVMAVSSTVLIWARRTERAFRAGMRYLILQVTSGVILLAGVAWIYAESGSIAFNHIGLESLGGVLIFIAFGIKCAWPFLHTWLTDAYPEATPTGTVFLSAFTTKVAVYCLARGYPGTELLIYIGTAMAVFPIFYAVIENDLRRVLAYSLINQVGFMVCGLGLGTALAMNGAISHAFNDVVFKGLLFMSMGAVLHMTGKINGSELGGLYKSMPLTTTFCIVGAASISAFPLFSGFVSKSMVMSAAVYEGYPIVFLLLLFASAGVFHHAGIKIPFFAFFAHDSGIRTREPPVNMLIAMGIAAFICIFNGSYPWLLYGLLPWPVEYEPYTATHVITQTQLLFFSALAFVLLMISGLYPPELRLINLDADWFYRGFGAAVSRRLSAVVAAAWQGVAATLQMIVAAVLALIYRYHGPRGVLARTWLIGTSTLWIAILLGVYLITHYAR